MTDTAWFILANPGSDEHPETTDLREVLSSTKVVGPFADKAQAQELAEAAWELANDDGAEYGDVPEVLFVVRELTTSVTSAEDLVRLVR